MSVNNFIPLDRKIMSHWLWDDKPFSKGQAWIDLLMLANYADKKRLEKGKIVTYKRGDVNLSTKQLADRWGWDRRTAKRFLDLLENDGMVSVECTTHGTTVTIVNYGFYNDSCTTECTTTQSASVTDVSQTVSESGFLSVVNCAAECTTRCTTECTTESLENTSFVGNECTTECTQNVQHDVQHNVQHDVQHNVQHDVQHDVQPMRTTNKDNKVNKEKREESKEEDNTPPISPSKGEIPKRTRIKEPKHTYGEYNHVLLTDRERNRLFDDYGEAQALEAIRYLDEYIQMKGYKAKDHNLAIRKWVFDALDRERQKQQRQGNSNSYRSNNGSIDWSKV